MMKEADKDGLGRSVRGQRDIYADRMTTYGMCKMRQGIRVSLGCLD